MTTTAGTTVRWFALALIPMCQAGDWTAGLLGGADVSEDASPFAMPWISYEGDAWEADPTQVAGVWSLAKTRFTAGVGVDYTLDTEDLADRFSTRLTLSRWIGPVQLSGRVHNRVTDLLDAWQAQTHIGTYVTAGPLFIGLGTGTGYETASWQNVTGDASSRYYGLANGELIHQSGDWQWGLTAQFKQPFTEPEDAVLSQTYTLMAMKRW